ncbi:cell envelope integrity protein CreD [Vibrio sonorensis]|uniref:cell envelope integrity protein CreD n=1 Tax=Vibrio sonorensis TaxID=1004316 RepID=UPI0008D9BE1D|nr:cell envelope integrity protein CreD [Vibrio sonorensis]
MKKLLKNRLGVKFAFVLFLFVLLQIPTAMISDLISERSYRQESVIEDIARSSSGEQRIVGPILIAHYSETKIEDGKDVRKDYRRFFLPKTFGAKAHLDSFEKYRGIYHARLYKAQTSLSGSFDLSELGFLKDFDIEEVSLIVGIQDSRGLIRLDEMTLNGKKLVLSPGTGLTPLPQGFHSKIQIENFDSTQPVHFNLNFLLQGMGRLNVTPIGDRTSVEISSSWPHPSFVGDYLPISTEVNESGFVAKWSSNNFSTNISSHVQSCLSNESSCFHHDERQMGVTLIEPVDHYLKSHRAINYSLLVITLVFASFFFLELFQARPVHPVQYGFVGIALALFYLMLISMSEHIGFNWAYSLSAISSTLLLSTYVGGMLSSTKQGAIFGISLMTLYAILFGLLQAESYALLMGTLLCFAILSLVMTLTRRVNWYDRNKTQQTVETDEVENEHQ